MRSAVARVVAGCLAIGFVAASVGAQEVRLRGAEAAIASNQRALGYYKWKSRREIVLDGNVLRSTVAEERLDEDGALVRTVVHQDSSPDDRKRPPKKKMQKAIDFGEKLESLVRSYTEMDRARLQEVLGRAKIRREEAGDRNVIVVQSRNVAREGDRMNILLDELTKLPQRYEVLTSLDGEAVSVTAEFDVLDGGPTYPSRIVVETEVKEDKLRIVTTTYDYEIR